MGRSAPFPCSRGFCVWRSRRSLSPQGLKRIWLVLEQRKDSKEAAKWRADLLARRWCLEGWRNELRPVDLRAVGPKVSPLRMSGHILSAVFTEGKISLYSLDSTPTPSLEQNQGGHSSLMEAYGVDKKQITPDSREPKTPPSVLCAV